MKTGWLALWCLIWAAPSLAANGWGDLKGRFVYDGDPPVVAALAAPGKPVDESLLVEADSRGVANIVIWIHTKSIDVHPSLPAPADFLVDCRWRNSQFAPHVISLRAGQTLVVKNDDRAGHVFQAQTLRNPPRALKVAPGQSEQVVFPEPESLPFHVTCLHPWEQSWILVRDNPYVAVTAVDGSFALSKLPAGELEFQFWHEKSGYLKAKPDWIKGRVKLKIAAEQTTDLGTVRLSPALLK